MTILTTWLVILTFIILFCIAYYHTSDHEIIYILKNYDFINDKDTKISYSDFNLIDGFWSGSYNSKKIYSYEAISNINGITNNVIIIANSAKDATINGKTVFYDSNKNVMLFDTNDDIINKCENSPEFYPEFYPESYSEHELRHKPIQCPNKLRPIFVNTDGRSIPITLISENVWAPKIETYKLIPKGSSTIINNVLRTIFSIPLIVIPLIVDILDILII